MAISDSYVVQFLLERTRKRPLQIAWTETGAGEYTARVGKVYLELGRAYSTTGERLQLVLWDASDRVCIEEPASVGILRARYRDSQEERLASLLRGLVAAIVEQVMLRHQRAIDDCPQTRDRIYRSLLFDQEIDLKCEVREAR